LNKQSEPRNEPPAFDEVLIVPLETNDSVLVGEIVSVQAFDSLIFISDTNNKLFVFNKDGKFKNYIGKIGKGPGEYLSIGAFCYDRFNSQVIILDNMNLVYFLYDVDGTFKSKITFEGNFSEAPKRITMIDENSLLIYYALYKENTAYKLFDFTSQKLLKTKQYQYSTCSSIYLFSKHPISSINNSASMIMPLCDTIFQCEGNDFVPKYRIEHSKKMAPIVTAELDHKTNPTTLGLQYINDGLFTGFNDIFETDNKLFLSYGFYGDNLGYFVADKTSMSGSYFIFSDVDNINNSSISTENLTYMPFFKPIETDENYLVSYVYAYNLLSLRDKINNECKDGNLLKLNNLIYTIQEEDNPVVFFYKLK
jgi:hypothetical protein